MRQAASLAAACRIFSFHMFPGQGSDPGPLVLGAQSLSHWTTKTSQCEFLYVVSGSEAGSEANSETGRCRLALEGASSPLPQYSRLLRLTLTPTPPPPPPASFRSQSHGAPGREELIGKALMVEALPRKGRQPCPADGGFLGWKERC